MIRIMVPLPLSPTLLLLSHISGILRLLAELRATNVLTRQEVFRFSEINRLDLHMDSQQASVQGNKLYVGGIPYRSTEDDMKKAFSEAGNVVSASIISDRMTGRSRGFGFVEMASEAEAQAAIDRWDGKDFDGRTLSVSFARPQGDRPPRREGGFGGGDRGGFGGGYGRGGY